MVSLAAIQVSVSVSSGRPSYPWARLSHSSVRLLAWFFKLASVGASVLVGDPFVPVSAGSDGDGWEWHVACGAVVGVAVNGKKQNRK